jgi:hypothetical protein
MLDVRCSTFIFELIKFHMRFQVSAHPLPAEAAKLIEKETPACGVSYENLKFGVC